MDCSPPDSSVHVDSPGKNTGVGCHSLLQGIFPAQGSNLGLPTLQADSLPSEAPGKSSSGRGPIYAGFYSDFPHSSLIHLSCRRPRFNSWVGKILWRRDRLPTPVFLGFPGGSAGKESLAMWESWVRSLGWEEGKGWRRERLPTPIFWPGEFHGLYGPWDPKELDTAKWLSLSLPDPMEIWPILSMVRCIFRVGPAQISDPRPPHSCCSPDILVGWNGWCF